MLDKIKRDFRFVLIAFAINIFYLLVCLFLGNLSYFGVVDDYFMARTLEGVFGNDYNVHLTFVNVVYGYLLLPLYHFFPKVGWYYVGEMTEVFISFTIISVVLLKKIGIRWGTILSMLFILFFARDFYLTIQFTQCAAVLGAAGMLLWVYGIKDVGNNKLFAIIGGTVLVLSSAMMRRSALEMGLPFFFCAMLLQIRVCLQNKRMLIIALLALFAGLYGIDKFNQLHYSSPEYHKYMEFQAPRAVLGDESNYDKGLLCDELEEGEMSCDDYLLLKRWIFYDTEVFAIDTLKMLAKKIEDRSISVRWKSLIGAYSIQMVRAVEKPGFWAFLFFSILLFYSKDGKGVYAVIAFLIITTLVMYLLYRQRFVYRVESGLWLYATTLAIPFIGTLRTFSLRCFYGFIFIVFIVVGTLFAYTGTYIRSPKNGFLWNVALRAKSVIPQNKALLNYIQTSPNGVVYLSNMNTYMILANSRNPPYLSEPIGSWKKIAPLGYWTPYFPDIVLHLEKYGISNPLRDVVLDNVYVINDDGLVDYLQRHYYDSVHVHVVKEFENVKVFKYSVFDVDKGEISDSNY